MPRDIDTPGGEYVELEIRVNGNVVFKRDCVLAAIRQNGNRRYKVDDTDYFTLNPRAGGPRRNIYSDIGKRMLEPKRNRRRPGDPQDDGMPDRPPRPKEPPRGKSPATKGRRG